MSEQTKLFRFHRGSLEESLKTAIEVSNLEDLKVKISTQWEFPIKTIKLEPYGGVDERINWDTHIVIVEFDSEHLSHPVPVGFTNFS